MSHGITIEPSSMSEEWLVWDRSHHGSSCPLFARETHAAARAFVAKKGKP